jgi:hypothetical protein
MTSFHWLGMVVLAAIVWYLAKHSGMSLPLLG